MHSPYLSIFENSKGSRHASAWNKISAAFCKLSLSTQLDVYSPSPNVTAETQMLPFVQKCVRSGCPSWMSSITVVIQAHAIAGCQRTKLHENLLFRLRPAAIALNYSVKNIRNDVREKNRNATY